MNWHGIFKEKRIFMTNFDKNFHQRDLMEKSGHVFAIIFHFPGVPTLKFHISQ